MNRKWQWAGVVLFLVAIIASAGNIVLSRDHPDEIQDARVTAAVFAAGLAVVGAILAITAYLSTKGTPEEKIRTSRRELIPPILVVLGPLAIANGIAWWNIDGGLQGIGIGVILMVIGALLLRKSER